MEMERSDREQSVDLKCAETLEVLEEGSYATLYGPDWFALPIYTWVDFHRIEVPIGSWFEIQEMTKMVLPKDVLPHGRVWESHGRAIWRTDRFCGDYRFNPQCFVIRGIDLLKCITLDITHVKREVTVRIAILVARDGPSKWYGKVRWIVNEMFNDHTLFRLPLDNPRDRFLVSKQLETEMTHNAHEDLTVAVADTKKFLARFADLIKSGSTS